MKSKVLVVWLGLLMGLPAMAQQSTEECFQGFFTKRNYQTGKVDQYSVLCRGTRRGQDWAQGCHIIWAKAAANPVVVDSVRLNFSSGPTLELSVQFNSAGLRLKLSPKRNGSGFEENIYRGDLDPPVANNYHQYEVILSPVKILVYDLLQDANRKSINSQELVVKKIAVKDYEQIVKSKKISLPP